MPSWVPRAIVLLFAAAAAACSSGPSAPDDADYLAQLATLRTQKDAQFRDGPESPVPAEQKGRLLPLRYYPIDSSYSVPGALQLADERPVFEMPTSTGKMRRMQRVGVLQFSFQGQPMTLGAFVEEGTQQIETLFVPFADQTTGKETYAAGRYLDLHPTATGYYTVDFNQAYNPYCAYNSTYDCPYPPPSNRLKVSIRAGEKAPGA